MPIYDFGVGWVSCVPGSCAFVTEAADITSHLELTLGFRVLQPLASVGHGSELPYAIASFSFLFQPTMHMYRHVNGQTQLASCGI
jgi:hypothetical protein